MPESPISSQGKSAQPLHLTPVKCSSSSTAGPPMSSQSSSVKKHKNRKYVEYWCKYCDKYFKHKNNMRQHERIHTNERPYSCAICGMSFKKSSTFLEHRRRHSGQQSVHKKETLKSHQKETKKTLQCHDCGKTFNLKNSLVTHARSHSDVKEFNCLLCNKDFRHRSTFYRHKLMHSGIKKFVCEYCQKGFFDKSDFKKHIKCHTQNSKLGGFKNSKDDKDHLGTVHPDKDTTSTAEKKLKSVILEVRDKDSTDNLNQFGKDKSNLSVKKVIYETEPLSDSVEICQENNAFNFSNDVQIKEDSLEICQENNAFDYSKDVHITEEIHSNSAIHAVEGEIETKGLKNESHYINVYPGRETALVQENMSQNAADNSSEKDTFLDIRLAETKDDGVRLSNVPHFHAVDSSKIEHLFSNSCKGVQVTEYENTEFVDDHQDDLNIIKGSLSIGNQLNEEHTEIGNIINDRQEFLTTEISTNSKNGTGSVSSDENCDMPNFEVRSNTQKETSNAFVTKQGKQNKSEKLKLHFKHIEMGIIRCVQKIERENKAVINDTCTPYIQSATSSVEQCHNKRNVTKEKLKTKTNNDPDTEEDMIKIDPLNACKEITQMSMVSIEPHVDKRTKETGKRKCCSCMLKIGPGRCHCGKERKCCEKKICEKCKHECTSRYDYIFHLKSHLIKSSYTCADCNRTFVKWRDYRRHRCNDEENKEKETKRQTKKETKRQTKKETKRQTKKQTKRQTKRSVIKHPCAYCSHTYKFEKQLKVHLFQRSLNTCKECLKKFCTSRQLEIHFKEHFKCQDCGFGCISKLALERHRYIKHYESSIKCEICKIAFTRKPNLARHIKLMHGGNKLYSKCKFCGRKFVKRSNCLKHEKNCLVTHNNWRIRDQEESQNVQVNVLQGESSGIESNTTLDGHDVCVKKEVDEISAGINNIDPIESINDYQEMKNDNLEIRCQSVCGRDEQKRTNFDMIYTRISNSCRVSECNSRKEIDKNISISVSSQNVEKHMKSSQRTTQQTKSNRIVKIHSEIQTDETSDDSDRREDSSINSDSEDSSINSDSEDSSINSGSEGYEECTAEEIQAMLNNMKEKKTL